MLLWVLSSIIASSMIFAQMTSVFYRLEIIASGDCPALGETVFPYASFELLVLTDNGESLTVRPMNKINVEGIMSTQVVREPLGRPKLITMIFIVTGSGTSQDLWEDEEARRCCRLEARGNVQLGVRREALTDGAQLSMTVICGGRKARQDCPLQETRHGFAGASIKIALAPVDPVELPHVLHYPINFQAFGLCPIYTLSGRDPPKWQSAIAPRQITATTIIKQNEDGELYTAVLILGDSVAAVVRVSGTISGPTLEDTRLIIEATFHGAMKDQTWPSRDALYCCHPILASKLILGAYRPYFEATAQYTRLDMFVVCPPSPLARGGPECGVKYLQHGEYACTDVTKRVELAEGSDEI
ncbi:uncharacterized protein L969DRAFT_95733 [Mixia osmundae IAM 14324]|uniref:Uncharacterized protein n=1 Tax=Mixia osmundae (strain CBS 9802 / IAM 14324 / JCM 22182 / KY 12970) TaxID=764103 RepID=G7E0P4_MIXOS|nr:uncharacterized protein L969DRAFT_95733 [Mixia osmundae IAM 14324]KEI37880.1 hypothetical protein L969DRAFT_95733 [Mixia osmundae IAM 14324]GAA96404.1 hypothetical protein E5Q_03071 [Mixia osmundae IAM 14324]